MIILMFFSFLAGVVTVLSPCILPLLPIILASSAATGKRQPYGVVIGFIVSFTFFTLFLTTIVKATGVSADLIRTISVVIILLFGLVLVIPKLNIWFEIIASKISNKFANKVSNDSKNEDESEEGGDSEKEIKEKKTGFVPGLLIGVSLGLIWTPCAGPILAFVISLALTGTVTGHAIFITLSYALGTAIPMFFIIYGGRKLIDKFPALYRNLGKIQKVFGVLMIIVALALYFNYDRKFQTFILDKFPSYGAGITKIEQIGIVEDQLDKLHEEMGDEMERSDGDSDGGGRDELDEADLAPELIPGGEWFNSEPLTLEELRGKVVLIDFWTYTCINCIRTLPYIQSWHEKYNDQGLVIIGVHTPEFEFEKSAENLEEAIEDFGLTYAIVQDNDYSTWRAYNNRYWPAKYFIDASGVVRDSHFGEGAYDESEEFIQDLIEEASDAEIDIEVDNPDYDIYSRTPETYLGYHRIKGFASVEDISRDQDSNYTAPQEVKDDQVVFVGDWNVGEERSMPKTGSELILNFESKEVFLVMRPEKEGLIGEVKVYVDGELVDSEAGADVQDGVVKIDTDRLYKLVNLDEPGRHILKLEFIDNKVEVYAFTFG